MSRAFGKARKCIGLILSILFVGLGLSYERQVHQLHAQVPAPTTRPEPRVNAIVSAASPELAGKYLVMIGGCNDCHTPGFMQQGMAVPEDQWLLGMPVGFRGPWGTTYGSNLRLFLKDFATPDLFIAVMRARTSRPPMPWNAVHAMSDQDLISLFRYIKSLPLTGVAAPEFVPAGVEPKTPYIVFEPQMPKTSG